MTDQTATRALRIASERGLRRRERRSSVMLGATGILAFVLVWEAASRFEMLNSTYFPPFSSVALELFALLFSAAFWSALGSTMLAWLIGLGIAVPAGLILGVLTGTSRFVREWTSSTIEFLRPIPSVALIPIAIVLFGINSSATVFIVIWTCFWVILVQVNNGVSDVDPVARSTAKSYGLNGTWRIRYVTWPTVLPYLMTGLRLCATIALVVAITIELVVGTSGIGDLIATSQSAGHVTTVYALTLLTGFLGLGINYAMQSIEVAALRWHPAFRKEEVR